MRNVPTWGSLALGVVAVACTADDRGVNGGVSASGISASASESAGASSGADESPGSAGVDDDGVGPGSDGDDIYDVGSPPPGADDGFPSGDGCDKVDFVFVIDNSGSMGDEQQNLANSFPSFINTIQEEVVSDFHILVTDMDAEDKWVDKYEKCDQKCEGEPDDKTCSLGTLGVITCGELPDTPPTACDGTLGAGRVYSQDTPPVYCDFPDGKRFLTDEAPDLAGTFGCAATMGAWGGGELGMASMLAANSPASIGPGGCNEGFLRDDAILVVTVISDEEDDGDSQGNPASWAADLLALKNNNETAVVVLGLVGDTALPDAVCPPDSVPGSNGGEDSPRLREFVQMFGSRGFLGSVCEPDYGPFFAEAVAVIDAACDEFEPEG